MMAHCNYCNHAVLSDGMVCNDCYAVTAHVPLNVPLIAEKIAWPEDRWAGNCHGVSIAFVQRFGRHHELPGARVRRGWITELGYAGQHSWIELERGIIVDPTLTALRGDAPRVLVHKPPSAYDPCGWRTLRAHPPDPPRSDYEGDVVVLLLECAEYVAGLLALGSEWWGDGYVKVTRAQAFWLAHLPVVDGERPRVLSFFYARDVYEALQAAELKVAIPIDAWLYVMDEPYPGEPAR